MNESELPDAHQSSEMEIRLALRIPKAFAVDIQSENDSCVEITILNGEIIDIPAPAPKPGRRSGRHLAAATIRLSDHFTVESGEICEVFNQKMLKIKASYHG